jgi:hypothetical protein
VGGLSRELSVALRDRLGLRRGIETGTLHGGGARLMSELFDTAVSIELSETLHAAASDALRDVPNVALLQGDSRTLLPTLQDASLPTLYFLDGHWSGGETAGEGAECPVLEEIAAIAAGHPDDCLVVDDARLFAASPPPPHDPAAWPTLIEVLDAIRAVRPDHHLTVLHDQIVAVPTRAKDLVDDWGRGAPEPDPPAQRQRLRIGRRAARPRAT